MAVFSKTIGISLLLATAQASWSPKFRRDVPIEGAYSGAGAVLYSEIGGTVSPWTGFSSSLVVPNLLPSPNANGGDSIIYISTGIEADNSDGFVFAGIYAYVNAAGTKVNMEFYSSSQPVGTSNFTISQGDLVSFNFTPTADGDSTIIYVENHTTGDDLNQTVDGSILYTSSETFAGWEVHNPWGNAGELFPPLANFTSFSFTDCQATLEAGTIDLSDIELLFVEATSDAIYVDTTIVSPSELRFDYLGVIPPP